MITRVNIALLEAERMRRQMEEAARPALHPLAEYYGDWQRDQTDQGPTERSFTISLNGDDE